MLNKSKMSFAGLFCISSHISLLWNCLYILRNGSHKHPTPQSPSWDDRNRAQLIFPLSLQTKLHMPSTTVSTRCITVNNQRNTAPPWRLHLSVRNRQQISDYKTNSIRSVKEGKHRPQSIVWITEIVSRVVRQSWSSQEYAHWIGLKDHGSNGFPGRKQHAKISQGRGQTMIFFSPKQATKNSISTVRVDEFLEVECIGPYLAALAIKIETPIKRENLHLGGWLHSWKEKESLVGGQKCQR